MAFLSLNCFHLLGNIALIFFPLSLWKCFNVLLLLLLLLLCSHCRDKLLVLEQLLLDLHLNLIALVLLLRLLSTSLLHELELLQDLFLYLLRILSHFLLLGELETLTELVLLLTF